MTELIFQNLYTIMKSGGDKEYIDNTIKDLDENFDCDCLHALNNAEI